MPINSFGEVGFAAYRDRALARSHVRKCNKIDIKIARYRTVIAQLRADDAAVGTIRGFILDLEAEKTKLHPQRQTA